VGAARHIYLFPEIAEEAAQFALVRPKPTQTEIAEALHWAASLAIAKRHHGHPPAGMDFEDLRQEIKLRTLTRLDGFRHGGKFTLREFTYVASCQSLADIHRELMRKSTTPPDTSLPLFD